MEIVNSFKVIGRTDSDHMLLLLETRDGGKKKDEEDAEENREEFSWRYRWEEEDIKMYKEKTEKVIWRMEEEETVEEKWKAIKELVQDAMVKVENRVKKRKIGYKKWWDSSCTKMKRTTERAYKNWRKGKIGRDKYMEEKSNFQKHLDKKKKKWKQREEQELRNLKNEAEVWKYINKRRGKTNWIKNSISKERWKEYFMTLLDGQMIEKQSEKEKKGEEERSGKETRDRKMIKATDEEMDQEQE